MDGSNEESKKKEFDSLPPTITDCVLQLGVYSAVERLVKSERRENERGQITL